MQIGLFFGSTTCYTEMAAEKIRDIIGADIVSLHNIKDEPLKNAEQYDFIIFGISTWDFGEIQEDWESKWDDIKDVDLNGKTIALFGMGDQQGYGQWFQDALGMLHDEINAQAITQLGFWPNDSNYEFEASKALTEDGKQFVGLALDEDSQYELSDERIATWVEQVMTEYAKTL
ncbi:MULTISPECIES: flavodoxin FldB [Pseudoalteromonas]|jgi:flavodoxin II|uniref:Flavodoxin n=1 Tax=Pseudoalteromonas tetraodonis TaxID=43659 RepID=A0ABD4ERS3_9GAMM|nr:MULTISPECIES: flavodoxin FldB [Pseudoalteromonas]PHQ94458.1 MAG: flavodoxin FldB [Pseudoalteromonas sp.]KYL36862.1 flavodoxin [Pseudoalteromonas spiralis]MDN3394117.1 flavodoxin FldB [Pseudoalteromonas sp. APC 3215]MDN3401798.1 flavodoxin FldB [Pseudoalteromonas sp. APC 3213]MDN3406180.1 flavodoxin FldB [Pseudoalteromonas sp. APC 3218]|tara:strand:+ start:3808 stop:4329 length:522 start_codon:yes stop_codon:yes gene_type:complete